MANFINHIVNILVIVLTEKYKSYIVFIYLFVFFFSALPCVYVYFQLAVEDKQGYSKFEMLCEELQKQELREKAKKEKKKKKKKSKKNDEGKENACRVRFPYFIMQLFEV